MHSHNMSSRTFIQSVLYDFCAIRIVFTLLVTLLLQYICICESTNMYVTLLHILVIQLLFALSSTLKTQYLSSTLIIYHLSLIILYLLSTILHTEFCMMKQNIYGSVRFHQNEYTHLQLDIFLFLSYFHCDLLT